LGSPKGSLTIDPGAKLPPLNLFAFPPPLATTCAVAPLNLSGRAERTLAVSEYISLVTLVTLRIVPERLILGLGTEFWAGERDVAVKAVSLPDKAARAAPVGEVAEVWSEVEMGETGSMKGSEGKESCGRVGVEPGGASRA
jgi:hypothetical protein